MIFTTENSASQINSALLSANREAEFKVADYNSITESNNKDLKQITNVLGATMRNVSQNVAEIAEETVGNWARSLNVATIGGPDYYIQTIKQNRGKLVATAKKIEEGTISYGPVSDYINTGPILLQYYLDDTIRTNIPAGSKLFLNLIVESIVNPEQFINISLSVYESNGSIYATENLTKSAYETIQLSGITKVAIPVACYTREDNIKINVTAYSYDYRTEVTYSVEGYYIKPLT